MSLRRSFGQSVIETVKVLNYICKNTVKLEELDLRGCDKLDINDISAALGPLVNRPALRRLNISGCNGQYGLGDMFVCPDQKPMLEHLGISAGFEK